ncbi:unannotated protein [freshwater metagenome]|uniref:Unannotated protein n=1 Tax=freshwater metagenome TaxID=449393 RepID=A0A6J7ETP0_9ZZZZ
MLETDAANRLAAGTSRPTKPVPTIRVAVSAMHRPTSTSTVAAIFVTMIEMRETGRVRSRSAVPRCSSSAVAVAPQLTPTAMSISGTRKLKSSTLRNPDPDV